MPRRRHKVRDHRHANNDPNSAYQAQKVSLPLQPVIYPAVSYMAKRHKPLMSRATGLRADLNTVPDDLPERSPRFTLLFSHGNAEDIGVNKLFCEWLSDQLSVDIVTYDYTGCFPVPNTALPTQHLSGP